MTNRITFDKANIKQTTWIQLLILSLDRKYKPPTKINQLYFFVNKKTELRVFFIRYVFIFNTLAKYKN